MGVRERQAYRNGFLKSDKWDALRLEALVKKDARCWICDKRDLSNDVHHVHYPPSFWDTEVSDLVVLCRPCHQLVHELMKIAPKEKDHGHCYRLFRMIAEPIRQWMRANRISLRNDNPKPPKIKNKCSACRKPSSPLVKCEVLAGSPKNDSIWSVCLECAMRLNGKTFTEFKDVRGLLVDRTKTKSKD